MPLVFSQASSPKCGFSFAHRHAMSATSEKTARTPSLSQEIGSAVGTVPSGVETVLTTDISSLKKEL